jgi:hypothetical protein
MFPRRTIMAEGAPSGRFIDRVIIGFVTLRAARQREWMDQWRRAGSALARVRADELALLPAADALAAADTLLSIGATIPLPVDRLTWSGLIEFQQYLHRRR